MATLAGLVDDVFRKLYGAHPDKRPKEDTLSGALGIGATSMSVTTDTMWRRDDYAEFADGEIVVCAADGSSGTVTIRRGQRTTTDAAHSSGDVMYRNPDFPRYLIEDYVEEVVNNDLWSRDEGVWSWHQGTISFTSGDTTYSLPAFIEDVVEVYQYNLNADGKYYPIQRNAFDVALEQNSAVATNGALLRLRFVQDENATVYYTGKRRPDSTDLANLDSRIDPLIPWAVLGKLAAAGMIQDRIDPPRGERDEREGGRARDYRGYMGEFLRMRNKLNKLLSTEVWHERQPRVRRRAW